jgi:hypothetical protein
MTPYGVARGYIAVGISSNNTGGEANSGQFSANRAFVQWAGFTAGQVVSFFDYYPAAAFLIRAGNIPNEDTGDGGWWVWAYTAQLGGGVTATLSAEERRMSQIIGMSPGAAVGGPTTPGTNGTLVGTTSSGSGYGGWQSPDIVANIRADETWGGAQVMGALHQLNPGYYGATPITSGPPGTWGWVVGVGLKLNFPMIAQGDYMVAEANYTQGATKYLWNANSAGNQDEVNGAGEGWGVGSDCVYGGTVAAGDNTSCQLTTAWEIYGAYEHYWTPQWHQSFVGSYMAETYNGSANAMLCSAEGAGGGAGSLAVATPGCNNNWQVWGAGSRLQWDVTKTFYLAVEALYQHLDSATLPGGVLTAPLTLTNSGAVNVSNEDNWTFSIRMHKDFYP